MEKLKSIVLIFLALLLQSCYEPGSIEVQNNISNVKITNVYWGDAAIAAELLPGESSDKRTIDRSIDKLPSHHKLSFTMMANNKSIFLETKEEFLLNEDEDLLIILTDETEVTNPNE